MKKAKFYNYPPSLLLLFAKIYLAPFKFKKLEISNPLITQGAYQATANLSSKVSTRRVCQDLLFHVTQECEK